MSEMKKGRIFVPADILEPVFAGDAKQMEKWAVIACDQFTSEPEYWDEADAVAGTAPSTLRLILPEVKLGGDISKEVEAIHCSMNEYLSGGIFTGYRDCYIYVQRTLADGNIRRGVVGDVDLEQYDIFDDSKTPVRASEKTVIERIPPRLAVREGAALELPHVLLLCDDPRDLIIGGIEPETLQLLYDFDLMEGGGNVKGWLVDGPAARRLSERLEIYEQNCREMYAAAGQEPVIYAVGDGNHSLATAKACWEDYKRAHPGEDVSACRARYALVELENIEDEVQKFEGIHRIVKGTDTAALLAALKAAASSQEGKNLRNAVIGWYAGEESGEVELKLLPGQLIITFIQNFLDEYLESHTGTIDYIHGADTVKRLAGKPGTIGFVFPDFDKTRLFRGIAADGACPRKTFSIGHAQEKRYYIEARRIG